MNNPRLMYALRLRHHREQLERPLRRLLADFEAIGHINNAAHFDKYRERHLAWHWTDGIKELLTDLQELPDCLDRSKQEVAADEWGVLEGDE